MIADSNSVFQMHLDGFEGFNALVDSVEDRVLVRQHANPLNEYKEDRELVCRLTTVIKKGSIIDLVDENEKWLVISDVDTDKLLKYCKIQKCNNQLSFYQTHISSQVIQIPYIVESGARSSDLGVDASKYIIQPDGVITIKVSNNDITKYIERNDIYKLSEFDNYEVIDIDRVKEVGLLIIKLQWCAEEQVLPNYSINIVNGNSLNIPLGQSTTLDIQVLDGITILNPTPTLIYASSNVNVLTISNGVITTVGVGDATITIKLASDETINTTINIHIEEIIADNFTVDVYGVTTIKINTNATFNANIYNNGVVDVTKGVDWVVTSQDGTSTQYVTIVSQTANSIVLKATNNTSYVNKYVVIKGAFTEDGTKFDEHVLQIKNAF
jgi:hypothetical protein